MHTPSEGREALKRAAAEAAVEYVREGDVVGLGTGSEEVWPIEVAIDGADQVDPHFNLVKGGGGALLREKIVAAAARRFVVIVDAEKRVSVLGHPMPVPVEVIPFGWQSTARLIKELGWEGTLRQHNGEVFRTDSGHYILDLRIDRVEDPARLETQLNLIPGVVENGLFVGRTDTLIVGGSDGIQIERARVSET